MEKQTDQINALRMPLWTVNNVIYTHKWEATDHVFAPAIYDASVNANEYNEYR